jgi:hypothetical protein
MAFNIVGYYPAYDSTNAPEIPWKIAPNTAALTELLYFAAMPKVVNSKATIDPAHFNPALNPAAIGASKAAAGSTANVLLVVGGANTDVSFKNCMTYRVGTVTVTQGSANVVSVGSAWNSQLVGEIFSRSSAGVPYVVKSVTDGTHLTLTANYAEASGSGVPYEIEWTERRTEFIASIVNYVAANSVFGGVDIDWEFPAATQQGSARFGGFMRALKAALVAKKETYILTSSSGGRLGQANNAHFVPMMKGLLVDNVLKFWFFQFYAMAQPGFSAGNVWHHQALFSGASSFGTPAFKVGVDEALARFLAAGLPAAKIIVGCQFGTRPWRGGNMDITHPGQGASLPCMRWTASISANRPALGGEVLYRDIVKLTGGIFRRDQLSGGTPFWQKNVAGATEDQFLSYEDATSIKNKVAYLNGKCGGIGGWHWGSDYNASGATLAQRHPIVNAIYAAVDAL